MRNPDILVLDTVKILIFHKMQKFTRNEKKVNFRYDMECNDKIIVGYFERHAMLIQMYSIRR